MTIQLKEDVAYILLEKISKQAASANGPTQLTVADFAGRGTDETEILAHIDYLNQKGYLEASFSGDAYAGKGPNPLPAAIELAAVQLTDSGRQLLQRMQENPPASLRTGPSTLVATKDMATRVLGDRKSTRLNSSHTVISYAVFCLKKKNKKKINK